MIEFQNRQMKLTDGSLVMVCRIVGSIDGSTLPKFEKKMLSFLKEGFKYLILVFSQVRYINSTGMGVLVKLADMFHEEEGEVNLVDVPEKLVALFNMLGLLALIKLSKTEEEALQQFKIHRDATAAMQKLKQRDTTAGTSSRVAAPLAIQPAPQNPATPSTRQIKNVAAPTPAPQQPPQQGVAVVAPSAQQKKRILLIYCQHCKAKISLGGKLMAGTYKCPRCMAIFKVLSTGKVKFQPGQ